MPVAASASQAELYFSQGQNCNVYTDKSSTFEVGHDFGWCERHVAPYLSGSEVKDGPYVEELLSTIL